MRNIFLCVIVIFLCISCETGKVLTTEPAYVDGIPAWVGNTFTNPTGYWGGYNNEKGIYTWGQSDFQELSLALKSAELDAKKRLAESLKISNPSVVYGIHRVDFFRASDGIVYVLIFISNKDLKLSKRKQ